MNQDTVEIKIQISGLGALLSGKSTGSISGRLDEIKVLSNQLEAQGVHVKDAAELDLPVPPTSPNFQRVEFADGTMSEQAEVLQKPTKTGRVTFYTLREGKEVVLSQGKRIADPFRERKVAVRDFESEALSPVAEGILQGIHSKGLSGKSFFDIKEALGVSHGVLLGQYRTLNGKGLLERTPEGVISITRKGIAHVAPFGGEAPAPTQASDDFPAPSQPEAVHVSEVEFSLNKDEMGQHTPAPAQDAEPTLAEVEKPKRDRKKKAS